MPRIYWLAVIAAANITACASPSPAAQIGEPGTIDFSDGFQQSDADAIVRICNANDAKLKVDPSGEVTFVPGRNDDYEASVCVLKYIKESGTTKFGFVGNEKYAMPEEGQ